MESPLPSPHPTDAELQEMACGRLLPAVADCVRRHVETCVRCATTVRAMSSRSEAAAVDQPAVDRPSANDATWDFQPSQRGERSASGAGSRIRYFGDYELLNEIARGAMGVVFRARQVKLDRIVALKTILTASFARPEEVRRFQNEARAAARLDHPGIVPIYEVGECEGHHFFSMAFVDGQSLAAAATRERFAPRDAAALVRQIAEAIAYAHARGVVHRDLKPSNVLLAADGTPKVADFGLAKTLDDQHGLTRTGDLLGTPNYMSPEQAAGESDRIGPPSDLFALGGILYFLLTGKAPFQGTSVVETLDNVRRREPIPPRTARSDVPIDLETICLKCLEKSPTNRYASAGELADDLGRFLRGEPIRARSVGTIGRAAKWCRRNPVFAGLTATIALTLVVGGAVSTYFAGQAARARTSAARGAEETRKAEERATQQQQELEAAERANRLQAAREALGVGIREVEEGRPEAAVRALLAAWGRLEEDDELEPAVRRVAWNVMTRRPRSLFAPPLRHERPVWSAAFSPDGTRIVTVGVDGSATLWDAFSGAPLGVELRRDSPCVSATFSADAKWIATRHSSGTVVLWDATRQVAIGKPLPHASRRLAPLFSPDSRRLITVETARTIRTWTTSPLAPAGPVGTLEGEPHAWAFSPNGERLVVADSSGRLQAWSVEDGRPLEPIVTLASPPTAIAFAPDGSVLAVAGQDGEVAFWHGKLDVRLPLKLTHDTPLRWLEWSADGRRLLTVPGDRTVRCWDLMENASPPRIVRPDGVVSSARFHPDGERFVTTSVDQTVRLWNASTGELFGEPLRNEEESASQVTAVGCPAQFSPDGGRLLTSHGSLVTIWSLPPSDAWSDSRRFGANVSAARFLGDEAHIVSVQKNGKLETWTIEGEPAGEAPWLGSPDVGFVHLSDDGRHLVTGIRSGSILVRDTRTGSPIGPLIAPEWPAKWANIDATGRRLVIVNREQPYMASLWDVTTGLPIGSPVPQAGPLFVVNFSPDGKYLATMPRPGILQCHDAETGAPVGPPLANGETIQGVGVSMPVFQFAFAPQGNEVSSASLSGRVARWRLPDGAPLGEPLLHGKPVYSVRYSADGGQIVTASEDSTARIWDVATGRPVHEPLDHDDRIRWADFSPDGTTVATIGADQTLRLWDALTAFPLASDDDTARRVRDLQFAGDGRMLLRTGDERLEVLPPDTPPPRSSARRLFAAWTRAEPDEVEGVRLLSYADWRKERAAETQGDQAADAPWESARRRALDQERKAAADRVRAAQARLAELPPRVEQIASQIVVNGASADAAPQSVPRSRSKSTSTPRIEGEELTGGRGAERRFEWELGDPQWRDYDVHVELRHQGDESFLWLRTGTELDQRWAIGFGPWGARNVDVRAMHGKEEWWKSPQRRWLPDRISGKPDEWLSIDVTLRGARITLKLGGREVATSEDPRIERGGIGFSFVNARWRNLEVRDASGRTLWRGWTETAR